MKLVNLLERAISAFRGLRMSCLLPCPSSEPPKVVGFGRLLCTGSVEELRGAGQPSACVTRPAQMVIKNLFLLLFFTFE